MFQLSHLDLELLDLAARFLINLAFSAAIFQTSFAQFFKAFDPAVDLLVADVVLDGTVEV